MAKVTMIKKDAVVNIPIGTPFLLKLQQLLGFIVQDLSTEQIEEFKSLVEKNPTGELPELWMEHLKTVSILITSIEREAIKQELTYEQDISDADSTKLDD